MEHHCLSATRIRRRAKKSSRKGMCGGRNNKTPLLDKFATTLSSKTSMMIGVSVVVAAACVATTSMSRNSAPSMVVNAFVLPSSSPLISSQQTGDAQLSIFQLSGDKRYMFGNTWTTRPSSSMTSTKRHQRRDDSTLEDDRKRKGGDSRDSNNSREQTKHRWTSPRLNFGKFVKAATPSLPSTSPRHYSDLKMREAEELGGIARTERYSSSDWLHNTLSLPSSAILRSIRGPVLFMTFWAGFLSVLYRRLIRLDHPLAHLMSIPIGPHSLMVSALSLLLVFKTNSAYQRFAEGRTIWEHIINDSRDLYRMMNLYENEMGRSKRRRLQRLLAAFPYLLRHRIRPNVVMYRLDDESNIRDPVNSILLYQDKAANDLDPEAAAVATQEENEGRSRRKRRQLFWVDKRTLPWRLLPSNALEPCARAQNRPLWVCDRMGQELRNIPDGPNFTARERLALISKVEKLSRSIGACERIHQTAVPLNYARHSLRALTLWLFTLPFCLVESMQLLTAPAIFLLSWTMYGVYEIGYSIEDPFQGTLRLSVLCDIIRRDVLADEVIRSTAFESHESDKKNQEQQSGMDATSSVDSKSLSIPNASTSSTIEAKNGDDDDDDEYESSPIDKSKRKKLGDGGWRVEELPQIPIKGKNSDVQKP
mmetsp:Transcript_24348/g.57698  ORF Transcript_24348/g.57698 Transcript_24348/m.57698 type:complete len:649 (+) Transcript_24348:136-2082(+)